MYSKLAVITVLSFSGCGTLLNIEGKTDRPCSPYGGVAYSVDIAVHGTGYADDVFLQPLTALDIPFSLVGDTATLPFIVCQRIQNRYGRPGLQPNTVDPAWHR
ncbi:MAG: hypothetical protein KY476_13105 [Planctomycetes bacterium]|nr:hypothetical protein [Planctomycetota bacterium]